MNLFKSNNYHPSDNWSSKDLFRIITLAILYVLFGKLAFLAEFKESLVVPVFFASEALLFLQPAKTNSYWFSLKNIRSKMKKIYQILILFFVGLVGVANADTEAIKASNNQLRLNYVNSHVDYTEKIDGNIADTEKGHVPGFGLSLSLMKDLFLGNDYIYGEFVRSNGDTNYVGSPAYGYPIITPGYGSYTTNHRARMTDINLRYGKGIEINNHFMITPYLEIGHHRWTRAFNNEAAVGGCTAYCGIYPLSSEEYNNSHFGIGSLFQYSSSDKLVMTGKIMVGKTYMASISGKGSSYLYTAPYVNNGFDKQRLGNDFMYMAGISADYAFTERIHGNVGVDYVDFRYGKSGLFDNYNYEPDSHTKYTSVNVGIGYAF